MMQAQTTSTFQTGLAAVAAAGQALVAQPWRLVVYDRDMAAALAGHLQLKAGRL